MGFKNSLLLTILVIGLLTACAGEAPSATPVSSATAAQVNPSAVPGATKIQPSVNAPTKEASKPTQAPVCTVRSNRSQPNPTVEALLSPIDEQDWTTGPKDASVTILEYSDFQ